MSKKPVTKRIYMALTRVYIDHLDLLINDGVYANRNEVIKDALRRLFRHYGFKPFVES